MNMSQASDAAAEILRREGFAAEQIDGLVRPAALYASDVLNIFGDLWQQQDAEMVAEIARELWRRRGGK